MKHVPNPKTLHKGFRFAGGCSRLFAGRRTQNTAGRDVFLLETGHQDVAGSLPSAVVNYPDHFIWRLKTVRIRDGLDPSGAPQTAPDIIPAGQRFIVKEQHRLHIAFHVRRTPRSFLFLKHVQAVIRKHDQFPGFEHDPQGPLLFHRHRTADNVQPLVRRGR